MSIENLILKANNNSKTAEWAENNAYYDVSISRYYYCLYEKAIYIATKKKFPNSAKGKDSHDEFIADFQKNISSKLSDDELTWLAAFGNLKKSRNVADYRSEIIGQNQFNLEFKYYYLKINSILDKLIN